MRWAQHETCEGLPGTLHTLLANETGWMPGPDSTVSRRIWRWEL